MENEILNYLKTKFNNKLKVEVEFIDFRKYKIITIINEDKIETDFVYDFGFTFETNMIVLSERICKLIIDYYLS
ncbi:MAG: hypothetical protein IKU37_09100 [Candidatus Gastranaerophilales bacterium]|nr:hypothetical protein [Candidatus Gastranaerophilales bacterium]